MKLYTSGWIHSRNMSTNKRRNRDRLFVHLHNFNQSFSQHFLTTENCYLSTTTSFPWPLLFVGSTTIEQKALTSSQII
jgi:hypothetical protein